MLCRFRECGRKVHGKGLCVAHYYQQHRGRKLTVIGTTQKDITRETGRMLGRRWGPVQGRRNAESGHMKRIARSGGLVGGQKAVESGHIQRIQPLGIHVRFHVNEARPPKTFCKYCYEEE